MEGGKDGRVKTKGHFIPELTLIVPRGLSTGGDSLVQRIMRPGKEESLTWCGCSVGLSLLGKMPRKVRG